MNLTDIAKVIAEQRDEVLNATMSNEYKLAYFDALSDLEARFGITENE